MSVKLEFISKGFKDILFSPGTKEMLTNLSDDIRDRANESLPDGEGFASRVQAGGYGGGRYVAFVRTDNDAAALEESENMTLTKAVRG
jgi:hypothetical protein